MTGRVVELINPGPAETPGSNDRRTGAPNHHQNSHETTGSGETLMVGATIQVTPVTDDALFGAVIARLDQDQNRYRTPAGQRGVPVSMMLLADLVTEIVTEYTEHLIAERDALAEDLAWEMHATRRTAGGA